MKRINSATEGSDGTASRQPAVLEESLHRRLASYAVAGVAAGVGVLAFAPPAKADIIITYDWDLNHDGITDFGPEFGTRIFFRPGVARPYMSNFVDLVGQNGNSIVRTPVGYGQLVGPGFGHFEPRFHLAYKLYRLGCLTSSGVPRCGWTYSGGRAFEGLLGLKFTIPGQGVHFGWITVLGPGAYFPAGYNTVERQAIFAGCNPDTGADCVSGLPAPAPAVPEPATLGLLALGSLGLGLWRRKKQPTATLV